MDYKIPSISVIIPMYNTEKYIGQCLNSLLNQTFQDFEIIVVDDCSTDNSVSEVEKIISKFNDRLKLVKLKKNSGGASIPRNIAIKLSRGKYIAFLDSDDLFINTTLEKFFNVAEKYNAEVVHMNGYFTQSKGMNSEIDSTTEFKLESKNKSNDKILLETDNIGERVKHFSNFDFFWAPWTAFVLRDFIIKNNIDFVNILAAEDFIFSFFCLCSAKIYVHIPDVLYIYRSREYSITTSDSSLNAIISKWVKGLSIGIKELDKFVSKKIFFKQHIEFKYLILNFFFHHHIRFFTSWIYTKFPYHIIDSLVRQELNKIDMDSSFIAHCFNMTNIYYSNLSAAQEEIAKLRQQIAILQQRE